MKPGWVLLRLTCAMLCCLTMMWPAAALATVEWQITVQGFEPAAGFLRLAIYDSETTYLKQPVVKKNIPLTPVAPWQEIHITVTLPEGTYAVAMYHDANGNGKFDKGFLGLPKERYGFSNNVRPTLTAPSFDAVKVVVDEHNTAVSIVVK